MDICIQADLVLCSSFYPTLGRYYFFFLICKLKVCDNPAFSKSIGTISPTHLLRNVVNISIIIALVKVVFDQGSLTFLL